MIIKLSPEQTARCLLRLDAYLKTRGPWEDAAQLDIAGIRTVAIKSNVGGLEPILRRQLAWTMKTDVPESKANSTLMLWEDPHLKSFLHRALGLDIALDEDYLMMMTWDGERLTPFGVCCLNDGFFSLWNGDKQYYCVASLQSGDFLKLHIFALNFARIADTPFSAMIHGACVGVNGRGVLLCARGGRGKSTLTVTSLFLGFEYVSDDYMILKKKGNTLTASPIYSSTALTPEIYNKLYDFTGPSRFIGLNGRLNKYMLDISGWRDNVRWDYPIHACIFPEIADVAEPVVIPCTPVEKGRALTHIVHSSIEQTQQPGNTEAVRKLIGMLSGLSFYRIVLSPDIFRNSDKLRDFVKHI